MRLGQEDYNETRPFLAIRHHRDCVLAAVYDNILKFIDLTSFYTVSIGTDDEDADNDIRRFAVTSYMDLLEKPVLPDILVRVICWVSVTATIGICRFY